MVLGYQIYKRWWFILGWVLAWSISGWAETVSQEKEMVLLINSYSAVHERNTEIQENFIHEYKKDRNAEVTIVYMNCILLQNYEAWSSWMSHLFKMYQHQPKAVVILGNEGWETYKNNCPASWSDIPVVVGNVKNYAVDYRKGSAGGSLRYNARLMPIGTGKKNIKLSGYYVEDYIQENFQLINRMQPGTKRLSFIYDNRDRMSFVGQKLDSIKTSQHLPFKIKLLDGQVISTQKLLESISKMENHSAILLSEWYTDVKQGRYCYSTLQNEFPNYSTSYMYMLQDPGVQNMNALGGYYVCCKDLGTDLASLLKKVLENPSVEYGVTKTPSEPRFYLNMPVFNRAGLNEDFLNDWDVEFYNKPLSLYETHRKEVLGIAGIILVLCMLIIFLFIYQRMSLRLFKKSNRRMEQLLEVMPNMAIIYDKNLKIVSIINPNLYSGQQPITNPDGSMKVSFGRRNIKEYVSHTLKTGENFMFDYEMETRNGKFYGEARIAPYMGDKVICFCYDITPIIQKQEELESTKTKLEMMFQATETVVWDYNPETKKLNSDSDLSILRTGNYTLDEFIDKYVLPEYREVFRQGAAKVLSGESKTLDIKIQTLSERNTIEWTHYVGRLMYDNKHKVKLIGTRQYITKDVLREQELIRLHEKAEESNRLKSAFLANMSHEIRTPLNAIVGFSNLLINTNDKEEQEQYIHIVEDNNEALLKLISDIIDYSKIESGSLELHKEMVDVDAISTELIHKYQPRLSERVRLVKGEHADKCMIYTDRFCLHHILNNLINNAIKFTSSGSIVLLYGFRAEGDFYFTVVDSGIGIPEEMQQKIFERFEKVDHFVSGNGLGLTICTRMADLLGGHITLESQVNVGSRFSLILPQASVNLD